MKRAAILLAVTIAGCQVPPAKPPVEAPAAKVPEIDIWGRSLQCADRADRLAGRIQADNARPGQDQHRVVFWASHYNRSDERCFVEVEFLGRPVVGSDGKTIVPVVYTKLFDAVEAREVASSTAVDTLGTAGQAMFCTVTRDGDHSPSAVALCARARDFIEDKMNN